MSVHSQPPEKAVASLPVFRTLAAAFAITFGNPGLLLRAAAGGLMLIGATAAIVMAVPAAMTLLLFLLAPLFAYCHFGVNWHRIVLLGPAGLPRPALRWDKRHWRVLAYAVVINLGTLAVQLPLSALMPLFTPLIALGVFYVTARLSFVFPAVSVEENYSLGLSWRHTAGQGLRLTAALLMAGLPLNIAVSIVIDHLFTAMVGISMTEIGEMASNNPEALTNALADISPASVIAVMMIFDILLMAILAVLMTIVALAFRTCTGWVPAGPGTVARVFDDEDGRDGDG